MRMSKNTVAFAAVSLLLSSSAVFAQTGGTATGGGAEGSMSGANGGMQQPGMMKKDGMKNGMSTSKGMSGDMKSGGMKSENGMTEKKM